MQDIHGFEGLYGITSCGKVWSHHLKRFMKPYIDKFGYYKVVLTDKNGQKYTKLIHRLVAQAYIPNPNNYDTVDHIDSDKSHNYINNLQWMTRTDNKKKSWCKKVRCIETGQTFNSLKEAAESVNRARANLTRHLKGQQASFGGYHWEVI